MIFFNSVLVIVISLFLTTNGDVSTEDNGAPKFSVANNQTLYHYILTGNDSQLNCTVIGFNSSTITLTVTNTSSNTDNVQFNSSSNVIIFKNSTFSNSGTYTCTASNDMGTTYLSYKTFIGGVANNIDLDLDTEYINNTYIVSCGITDNSQAPAQSINVIIPGLISQTIVFVSQGYTLPVSRQYMQLFSIDLDKLYRAEYQIHITSNNVLGSYNVLNKSVFIDGSAPVGVSVVPDQKYVNVTHNNTYTFTCQIDVPQYIVIPDCTFTVTIDNTANSTKFERLIKGAGSGHNQTYTFINSTYLDDNTTFICIANSTYKSDISTMTVLYAPVFSHEITRNIFYNTNTNKTLPCTVLQSDPPVTNMTVSIDSKYTGNVKVVYSDSPKAAEIIFNKTRIDNGGEYTCTATNIIGSSNSKFSVYVGGSPDNIDIDVTVDVDTINKNLIISLVINDNSNAPATDLIIELSGLPTQYIIFHDIPVHNKNIQAMKLSLHQLLTANYTLTVHARNPLGDMSLYNHEVFIKGTLPLSVNLISNQTQRIQGDQYIFTCDTDLPDNLTSTVNLEFTLLFNYESDTNRHSRLIKGHATPTSQQYILTDLSYLDDNVTVTCAVNNVYKSEDMIMSVYYPPVLSINGGRTVGGFINQLLRVNYVVIRANPSNYSVNWYKDNKPLHSSKHVIVTDAGLIFNSLTSADQSLYTLRVNNDVLNGSSKSFSLMAYDGPYFKDGRSNGSKLVEHMIGSSFEITCVITGSSPPVNRLTIVPEEGTNWNITERDTNSVTLSVTEATVNNTHAFMCIARNNMTTATFNYTNYIGGIPSADKTVIKISKHDNSTAITLDLTITDNNDAPLTSVSYSLEGYNEVNVTKSIDNPTLQNIPHTFSNIVDQSYTELGTGRTRYLYIYAHNQLGTLVLKYNFTVPGHLPTHTKVVTIVVSVVVPVVTVILIIILVIIIVAVIIKRRRRTGYVPIDDQGCINRGDLG